MSEAELKVRVAALEKSVEGLERMVMLLVLRNTRPLKDEELAWARAELKRQLSG